MIFSVRRSQYCISHSKSQRLFVTRHRLSCEKVNLHNKLVTWAWDTCDFTSYSTRFVSFRFISFRFVSSNTISPQITFHLSHSISAQLNLYETLNFINQTCIYRNQNFLSSSSLRTTLPTLFTWIWTSYPTCVVVSYNQELVILTVIERLRETGSHMAPCQILHALFTQEYNVF